MSRPHNPRDSAGRRIPTEGSRRRKIYDAIVIHKRSRRSIAAELNMTVEDIHIEWWNIVRWEKSLERAARYDERKRRGFVR